MSQFYLSSAENDNSSSADQLAAGSNKQSVLNKLRQQISSLEQTGQHTGLIDDDLSVKQACPPEALPSGMVHEFWAQTPVDMVAACAGALANNDRDERPILWITSIRLSHEHGLPYGPGLVGCGLDPSRFFFVCCRKQEDVLWAMEEGLKSPALACVVGEVSGLELTASRRLNLITQQHGTQGLLLVRSPECPSTASFSRWLVRSSASVAGPFDPKAPGTAQQSLELIKHRGGGKPVTKRMEWPHHAEDSVSLAASLADRQMVSTAAAPAKVRQTS